MPSKPADPFVEPTDRFIRTTLLLSPRRALVGAVPPSLRGVTCGWSGTEVKIRYIFDGSIDPDEEDDILVVGAEVIADFPSPWTIDDQALRVDCPEGLAAYLLDRWAYMREEAPPDDAHGRPPATNGPRTPG